MAGILAVTSRALPRNVVRLGVSAMRRNASNQSSVLRASVMASTKLVGQDMNVSTSLTCERLQWRSFKTSAMLASSEIVKVPPFADSVSEGDVRFTKKVGDSVSADEVVMEIETDKTTVGVPAPAAGVIEEIFVADGDTVKAGQQLFKMKRGGGGAAPSSASSSASSAPPPTATSTPTAKPAAAATSGAPTGATEIVKVPPFADSVSEGDVKFDKKVGDAVAADEVVMEIETDKTTVGVPSPTHGIIEEIFVSDGDTVKAGQQLFKLKVTGAAPAGTAAPSKSAEPAAAPSPPPPQPTVVVPPPQAAAAAPPPQARAAAPPPPPPPRPTAPAAKMPVAAIRHAQAIEAASVKIPPTDYSKEITGTRTEQRVKMNRMRQKIASRLKEAQNVNAMLTTFNEIDMSHIIDFRKQAQDAFTKKYGIKLGFMSAFCKAAAYALQDQPVVNAVIEGNEIVYRDYVDISVAVASPKGLVVPVIRNCESMNYAEIELAITALGEKARKGNLAVEDMDGGTFTISNGGVFGSLMGTPIINPPQSAILGMHATFDRPVAIKGQVVIRPMMYVALTYDHRLIDGREAVTFLRKIKAAVEDPRIILAGL